MSKAARKAYDTDVIARTLVKHLDKSSLCAMMRAEQKGDMFDWCTRELYRNVKYDVIRDLQRDSMRKCRYLDAVQCIDANTDPSPAVSYTERADRAGAICSPSEVDYIRLKCPNVRLIKRHTPPPGQDRFTIILQPGKRLGTVRLHKVNSVSRSDRSFPRTPDTDRKIAWPGWNLKLTYALKFAFSTRQFDEELVRRLHDVEDLDEGYTEINTGPVVVPLRLLGEIAESRIGNKKRITRFTAGVTPFTFDDLVAFVAQVGDDLIQLDLCTGAEVNKLTVPDMPRLVKLVRKHCPRLISLSLPISAKVDGRHIQDEDIDLPTPDTSFAGGKLKVLAIKLHRSDIPTVGLPDTPNEAERLLSFNFVRNLACLARPGDCAVYLSDGDKIQTPNDFMNVLALFQFNWWISSLDVHIGFFHRLGPILEPHFRTRSLAHMGLSSLIQLDDLLYQSDGTPMTPEMKAAARDRNRVAALKRKHVDMMSGHPHYRTWSDEEACEAEFQAYQRREEQKQRLYQEWDDEQFDRVEEERQRWEDEQEDREEEERQRWEEEQEDREEEERQRWEDEQEDREEMERQRWEDEQMDREEEERRRWEDEQMDREEEERQRWEDEQEDREEEERLRWEDEQEDREEKERQRLEDEQADREENERQRWEDGQDDREEEERQRREDDMEEEEESRLEADRLHEEQQKEAQRKSQTGGVLDEQLHRTARFV